MQPGPSNNEPFCSQHRSDFQYQIQTQSQKTPYYQRTQSTSQHTEQNEFGESQTASQYISNFMPTG